MYCQAYLPALEAVSCVWVRVENGNVFFIDSILKDEDGDGVNEINGVSERDYSIDDERIKSYGIVVLKKKIPQN